MKILFLCNKSPYPAKEGGPIAMNSIIEGLVKAGNKVKVIALNTDKYFVKAEEIPEGYREKTNIEFIFTSLAIKPLDAFFNLFSSKSYHIERFISKELKSKLKEVLQSENWDIVQLEMLYMTPYVETIREYSKAKIVLRSHNVEHLIWKRITSLTKNPIKKAYLSLLTKKLENYEISNLNSYDGIATISKKDKEYFLNCNPQIPITDISFGVDTSQYNASDAEMEFPSLFHLGSMNWVPNEEGVKWFLEEVWPKVHKNHPYLRFYLAGRNMPDWLTTKSIPGVEIVGEVDDAQEFICSKGIMIVPLFSGSGIRIKIIEGMALNKAIISTDIGAEGINYTHEKNIMIANTPEDFIAAIDKCIADKEFCINMGKEAAQVIEHDHNNEVIIPKLEKFYKDLLKK
jgi:glycosyltransferase involved in cell wall biosynthesis